uniref:Replication enhancer n=1 Tax=Jatropha mosaic Nigeria virus TaxID=1213406 RepID=I7BBW1_9GEMI|nr:C3 [Jatropha mosaic Nigeria virus]
MDSRTGEYITAPQAGNGVFIWEINNPRYFTTTEQSVRPFNTNHDIITLQIRFNHNLRKELGLHKCYLNFRVWTTSQTRSGTFLRVFKTQVLKYLDMLGVISINNVIRSVDHVLHNVIRTCIEVQEFHEIKFKFY